MHKIIFFQLDLEVTYKNNIKELTDIGYIYLVFGVHLHAAPMVTEMTGASLTFWPGPHLIP